jgi:DNA-directed RNA polymerase subunit RPC12/RpoP
MAGSLVVAAAYRQDRPMRYTGPAMTLGNMRANGVRAVTATCLDCGREADVVVDSLPDAVFVPEAGRRMVCSACGGKRIDTRPAWHTMTRPGMGAPV